jgi:hypothetical protein
MSLLQVTNHEASSSLPQRLKPPMQFSGTRQPWHSPLADVTMEQEITSHGGNSQWIFATLPLKLNGQIKIWVHPTESHPIQQSPGMIAQWSSPAEPSGTRHSYQIHEKEPPVDPHLGAKRNHRTISFIHAEPAVPTPSAGSRRTDRAERPPAQTSLR